MRSRERLSISAVMRALVHLRVCAFGVCERVESAGCTPVCSRLHSFLRCPTLRSGGPRRCSCRASWAWWGRAGECARRMGQVPARRGPAHARMHQMRSWEGSRARPLLHRAPPGLGTLVRPHMRTHRCCTPPPGCTSTCSTAGRPHGPRSSARPRLVHQHQHQQPPCTPPPARAPALSCCPPARRPMPRRCSTSRTRTTTWWHARRCAALHPPAALRTQAHASPCASARAPPVAGQL